MFSSAQFVPNMPGDLIPNSTPCTSYAIDAGNVTLESDSANEKTKRPMNAFFLWSNLQRKNQLHGKTVAAHQNDVCRSFGAAWKQLSKEEQQPFYDEAKRLAAEHKRLNPDYKYNPRRKSVQQKTRTNSKGERQQSKDPSRSIASIGLVHPSYSDHHRGIVAVAPGASTLLHIKPKLNSLTSLHNNVGEFSAMLADAACNTYSTSNTSNTFGGDNSSFSFPGAYNVRGTPREFASSIIGTYDISENDNENWYIRPRECTHATLVCPVYQETQPIVHWTKSIIEDYNSIESLNIFCFYYCILHCLELLLKLYWSFIMNLVLIVNW